MIDLTPLEVRQKKGDFRNSFRGYDPELVNDFLDLVADRMEELVKKNMDLSDAVESLEEELEEYRIKERGLSDALMAAQQLREDARSHADKEGELMIREARMAAESARQEATKALAREEEALRRVRARRGQLVESFRRLLERELSELAVVEETLELQDQTAPAADPASPMATPEPEGAEETVSGRDVEAKTPKLELTDSEGPEPGRTVSPAADGAESAEAEEDEEDEEDEVQEDWLKSLVEE